MTNSGLQGPNIYRQYACVLVQRVIEFGHCPIGPLASARVTPYRILDKAHFTPPQRDTIDSQPSGALSLNKLASLPLEPDILDSIFILIELSALYSFTEAFLLETRSTGHS